VVIQKNECMSTFCAVRVLVSALSAITERTDPPVSALADRCWPARASDAFGAQHPENGPLASAAPTLNPQNGPKQLTP
jgi:hypothetical protein